MKIYVDASYFHSLELSYKELVSDLETALAQKDKESNVRAFIDRYNELGAKLIFAKNAAHWLQQDRVCAYKKEAELIAASIENLAAVSRDEIRELLRPRICDDTATGMLQCLVREYQSFTGLPRDEILRKPLSEIFSIGFAKLSLDWKFEVTINYFTARGYWALKKEKLQYVINNVLCPSPEERDNFAGCTSGSVPKSK